MQKHKTFFMRKTILLISGLLLSVNTIFAQVEAKTKKMAVVKFDDLVRRMPAVKAINQDIEKTSNVYQSQLEQMAKEGQEKYQRLQNSSASMTDPMRKVLEEDLMRIQQTMQSLQASAEQEIQQKQSKLVPLAEGLARKIKEYGKENNYSAIFYENALLYFGAEIEDLTELIASKNNIPKESPAINKPTVPAAKPVTPAKPATHGKHTK